MREYVKLEKWSLNDLYSYIFYFFSIFIPEALNIIMTYKKYSVYISI